MSMNWEVKIPDGRIWYVGSWNIPNGDTDAQVIIPVEQMDGLTDEQIGSYARKMTRYAIFCNTDELAYDVLATRYIPDQSTETRRKQVCDKLRLFADESPRIARALAVMEGRAEHPLDTERRARLNEPKPEAKRNGPGHIYLLRADTGHYKIGYTKDLSSRMKAFGLQLPFKIELIHTIRVSNMHGAETILHDHFAHCRVNGEWFNLAADDVTWFMSLATL